MAQKRTGKRFYLSNWRIKALFLIFLIFSVLLLNRLYTLQVVNGDYYSALALGQQSDLNESLRVRGEIYAQDKGGETQYLLAANRDMPMVYAVPSEIDDEQAVLDALGNVVEITDVLYAKLITRLQNKESLFAMIARELTESEAEQIRLMRLDGIYLRSESIRFYPALKIASHLLGFVGFGGDERAGQYGIERFYNDILSGSAGSFTKGIDGLRNVAGFFAQKIFDAPVSLQLTIDYGAQFVVEKKLENLVEYLDADSASAIFMDPATGAIIVMANVPAFDPNNYNEVDDIAIFRNNATQSLFEPGSVFKPITMASAIDAGAVSPSTVYTDEGVLLIDGYKIYNSDLKAHGTQTMTGVLEKSLNTGVIFVQQTMGKKAFRKYLEAFKLDEITGIDLPSEAVGDINNIKNTNRDINFATASFGQGIAISPLRLLTSLSAIANNGIIMKPYIVNKIIYADHEVVTKPVSVASPISSITASRVTAMMVSVIENGFGKKAAVPGYAVAGKTGTAQVPSEKGGGYDPDRTIHSFIGFAPAYNPRFIGIIKVDNPRNIKFSADSVAPVFGEITSFLLQYYKIPPQ